MSGAADRGVGVVWATQRVEEISGFADVVTVLDRGSVRFSGSVAELLAASTPDRFVLQLASAGDDVVPLVRRSLDGVAAVAEDERSRDHVVVTLTDGTSIGQAIALLARDGVDVVACREVASGVERAFLRVLDDGSG